MACGRRPVAGGLSGGTRHARGDIGRTYGCGHLSTRTVFTMIASFIRVATRRARLAGLGYATLSLPHRAGTRPVSVFYWVFPLNMTRFAGARILREVLSRSTPPTPCVKVFRWVVQFWLGTSLTHGTTVAPEISPCRTFLAFPLELFRP